MQVNINQIQRPTLFQEFFDKLLTYSNEVIEYINTSTFKNVTSNKGFPLVSLTNNIKTFIKKSYTLFKSFLKNAVT